jgi:hypothetical protein
MQPEDKMMRGPVDCRDGHCWQVMTRTLSGEVQERCVRCKAVRTLPAGKIEAKDANR